MARPFALITPIRTTYYKHGKNAVKAYVNLRNIGVNCRVANRNTGKFLGTF